METTAFNLKKAGWSLAFALALALAACLLAGNSCRPVFAAETAAGSAVSSSRGTDSKDRKKTAAKDADADEGKKEKGKGEDAGKLVPFDQAMESFYSDYDAMTDRAILQSAKNVASDGDVLLSKFDENGSNDVMAAMDAYEAIPSSGR